MNSFRFSIAALLLVSPAILSAHTHKTLMGTIKSVDGSRMVLVLKQGGTQTIPFDKDTRVLRAGKAVGRDQVKPGLRAVVVLAEDDTTAEAIKLPAKVDGK